MNIHQKMVVAVMDVAMVAELCVSIYLANLDPDNFNPIFFKHFFLMLIPTLILARIAVKKLKTKETQPA